MLWDACRLAEEEIVKHVTTTDADIGRAQALSLLRSWYLKTPVKHAGSSISNRCAALCSAHGSVRESPHEPLRQPLLSLAQQRPMPAICMAN